jgi:hypothetical protein
LVGKASGFDLVLANINGAVTSLKDVTGFNKVRISILKK